MVFNVLLFFLKIGNLRPPRCQGCGALIMCNQLAENKKHMVFVWPPFIDKYLSQGKVSFSFLSQIKHI